MEDRPWRWCALTGAGLVLLAGAGSTFGAPRPVTASTGKGTPEVSAPAVAAVRPDAPESRAVAAVPEAPPVPPTTGPPPTSAASPPVTPSPPPPPTPAPPSTTIAVERVVAFALARTGAPYVFGAPGPRAYDCSGLVRAAYAAVGVDLAHHAAWQAERGHPVDWRHAPVAAGDLVFVRGGRPVHDLGHVGIAVGDGTWVEASSVAGAVRRGPIPWSRVQAVRRILTA